jgi:hypothetical protein
MKKFFFQHKIWTNIFFKPITAKATPLQIHNIIHKLTDVTNIMVQLQADPSAMTNKWKECKGKIMEIVKKVFEVEGIPKFELQTLFYVACITDVEVVKIMLHNGCIMEQMLMHFGMARDL